MLNKLIERTTNRGGEWDSGFCNSMQTIVYMVGIKFVVELIQASWKFCWKSRPLTHSLETVYLSIAIEYTRWFHLQNNRRANTIHPNE